VRPSRLLVGALALGAAAVLLALGLVVHARRSDPDAPLRAAVAAFDDAARADRARDFDNGVTRANLRSRAQALLTDVAIGDDRKAAAQADVLLGVLAARSVRSAAGLTPDELSRDLFETAVVLDPDNSAAKFDLELVIRRMQAVGTRTGTGQGSGPRGGGRRGAGAGQPGRGY
jgi:hypothetical protein